MALNTAWRNILALVASGAGVLAVTVSGAVAVAQEGTAQGDVENGKGLYETTGCYQCHGWEGQGGAAGPRLQPALAYEPFVLQLRQPRFVMIPYSDSVLSDQEAADIYAYALTFPPPADPASIPLLQ